MRGVADCILELWDHMRARLWLVAHMKKADWSAALQRPDVVTLSAVCALGLIGGFVLFAYAAAFTWSVLIALFCSAPAIALYWLGRLHHMREAKAVRRRAELLFDGEIDAAAQRG